MSIFMVRQMHDKFGFKRLSKPGFLPPDLMKMRLNFLLEELLETAEACGYRLFCPADGGLEFEPDGKYPDVDLEKAFDGLLDLEVVLHGTADLMGLGGHVPEDVTSKYGSIWTEGQWRVHQANMAKQRVPKGEVGKRGSDHDLIKPKGWKPPQFKDLLK